ncbi:putative membrane protein [Deinococcus metalli]|uniref:Putative membrane protein n=1 Tax=Deinococcus metalli TaxID=1141878 RepID=A0A7W8KGW0_9DEIO|nr:DUF1622 domain-containing protein [Deinococcus metalli]MBB5376304.1 putative membrane protein [Deinococcus metalli]GHF39313.1 hypothetical protein GCM10017781_14790 [Deinococcus metalli]
MTFLSVLRLLIDVCGSVALVLALLASGWTLLRTRDPARTQRVILDGIVFALNLKTAATLLRTTELTTWSQIGMFAAIFALRTVLARVAQWERRSLSAVGPSAAA